jgi:hypothetical protein
MGESNYVEREREREMDDDGLRRRQLSFFFIRSSESNSDPDSCRSVKEVKFTLGHCMTGPCVVQYSEQKTVPEFRSFFMRCTKCGRTSMQLGPTEEIFLNDYTNLVTLKCSVKSYCSVLYCTVQ